MIKQRVVLRKLKTDDGYFDFEGLKGITIGMSFLIECNSFRVMQYRRKVTQEMFSELTVRIADEGIAATVVPVEVLEFTGDFYVTER